MYNIKFNIYIVYCMQVQFVLKRVRVPAALKEFPDGKGHDQSAALEILIAREIDIS